MSLGTMLNTRTIRYLELIGNGKRYHVPPYQRDYSWNEEQWDDLWNDITDLHRQTDSYHYMGALVVQEESDRDLLIIDGQERMATLSILALAVIALLDELARRGIDPDRNRERMRELRNRFIGKRYAGTPTPLATLNRDGYARTIPGVSALPLAVRGAPGAQPASVQTGARAGANAPRGICADRCAGTAR